MNHQKGRGLLGLFMALGLCAASDPQRPEQNMVPEVVWEAGWNLVTMDRACAGSDASLDGAADLHDLGSSGVVGSSGFHRALEKFDGLASVWGSRPLSLGGVVWEPLDASLPSESSPDVEDFSKAYWVFSESRQGLSFPCGVLTGPMLEGGARWDAEKQGYLTSTSTVNAPLALARLGPPQGFQAVADGRDAKFQWKASERFMDGSPIPEWASIRYRVYRDGAPVFEGQDRRFEDRLPSDGPHRYYVTAGLVEATGAWSESERSEDIDMVSVASSPLKARGAFEVPVAVTEVAGASLPQLAFVEFGGHLVAHLAFVVRDRVSGLGDQVQYVRSMSGGRRGSWGLPLSLKSGNAGEISDMSISSHRSQVVLAWIEKDSSLGGGGRASRVYVLKSDDGGLTWPRSPREVRSNDDWKRGLDLAHDVLGALHAVWGEAGKVYYVKDFRGEPSNVFDVRRRKFADEIVKYQAQYEEGASGCRCADCWCEESYVLGDEGDAYVHWVEEYMMHEPSLHVDKRGIHIMARRSAMWDNVPVSNPAWDAMHALKPIYSREVVYGERVTRPVVGWRKTWKHSAESNDEAELSNLGVSFQYLYSGSWHREGGIMLAQRPLVEGPWSDAEAAPGSDAGSNGVVVQASGSDGDPRAEWQEGEWVGGVLQAWRITTLDVEGDAEGDLLAHPHIGSGPEGRLYAAYERGPSKDPNVLDHNVLMLTHSDDGGRSWSAGMAVGHGYMPKLASTSNAIAVLSYAPYRGDGGPQKTLGGVIQVARTSDGRTFSHETVNVFWNRARSDNEVAVAGVVHGRTHGAGADGLEGVPFLVAHEDLLAAAWVGAPQGALGGQDVMVARASLLEPDDVETRVVVSSTGPLVSGRASSFRVQVENQYHVTVPESLGTLRFVEGDAQTFSVKSGLGKNDSGSSSFVGQGGSPLAASLANTYTFGGSTATLWRAFDGAEGQVALSVQSDRHIGAGLQPTPISSGSTDGNYARAVELRDGRYNSANGAQREFLPDEGNEDTAKLAEYERVWVYTQGIALAQASRRGEENAGALARWLCDHAVRDPADASVILGWHFSHNTAGDQWKDFRLVTGANAWAVHGLGVFVTTMGRDASFARACYQASLRGLLRAQTDSGLFTAGYTSSELEAADSGEAYYRVLDRLGYDEETPRVRAMNVVTEHNVDALQVLNHALQHQGLAGVPESELRRAKEALKQAIFSHLWDPDEKRIITGGRFDRTEFFVPSEFSAVDNCSWLSLSVDYASLADEEVNKIAACLQYTIDAFVKELPFDDDPQDRLYLGTHYFPSDFRDPYIDLGVEEQTKQPKSYHLEATAGVILGLWRFADETNHAAGAGFHRKANDLWAKMQRFVRDHDFPYSSQRIHNLSTQLQSSTAAIWFIDVYDHQQGAQDDLDRPLKSYARLGPASDSGPVQVSLEGGQSVESRPQRAITAKMVREHLIASEEGLDRAVSAEVSQIADQGIWNPENLEVFKYRANYHNDGQYDPAHFDVDIDLPEAWSIVPDAGDFVVAVIDSGGRRTDPLLNYWTNPREIPDDHIDNDNNGYVDDTWGWDFVDDDNDPKHTFSHGSTVARWLAQVPSSGAVGVAPGAQVIALRALEEPKFMLHAPLNDVFGFYRSPTQRIVDAMDYAIDLKLRHERGEGGADVRVINMSLSVRSPAWGLIHPLGIIDHEARKASLAGAIDRANAAGIMVVAAGANERDVIAYPSELFADNLLGVVSSGTNDEVRHYSDRGRNLELAAPLYYYDYYSTISEDRDIPLEGLMRGNSLATPMVSGAALLMWRLAPEAPPEQIRQALMYGVDRRPSLAGVTVSGGRLNVMRAMQHLRLAQLKVGSPGERRSSAIEDKIEEAGTEIHYHVHLPEGVPLRVEVEPLWLNADTAPTLWPSLKIVEPNGKRQQVDAEDLGASLELGPLATIRYYGDDHYRFIITGLSDTTGPFRLRLTLGDGETEALSASTGRGLTTEDHAIRALAWLSLGRIDDAKNSVAEILADLGEVDPFDPLMDSENVEVEPSATSRTVEETALGLYGLLQYTSHQLDGAGAAWLPLVGRRLPNVATRALAEAPDSAAPIASLVYVYFALDLALSILEDEVALRDSLELDVLPLFFLEDGQSLDTLRTLMERVASRLNGDLWNEVKGQPFGRFSSSGGMGEASRGDMVLYGLFSLHRGELAKAQRALRALEDGEGMGDQGASTVSGAQRFFESQEALILFLRAASPLDPRLEELALARLLALPSTLDSTRLASRILAQRPEGVFGIRVGPSTWMRDVDDRNPAHGVGLHFFGLSLQLLPLFRDGLYALLASGFEPHVFDYWVQRLDHIRFAYQSADDERWPYQWVEAFESRNREVTLNETLWDLAHLCDLPMMNMRSDHYTFLEYLGISCALASEAFSERLEARLGGAPSSDLAVLMTRDGSETLRFSQLVGSLHTPLPRTIELHDGPPGLTFGTLEGHAADFDSYLFPIMLTHFRWTCFDSWSRPNPNPPSYCEPPADDASAEEVQEFLRTLRSQVLKRVLSEGEEKGHPVAFQLWAIDGLEALNPGSPIYWAPTSIEYRAMLDWGGEVQWWFLDVPVESVELPKSSDEVGNGLWLRRLINQEANGDVLRVASLVGRTPGTVHQWLSGDTLNEGWFLALDRGLGLGDRAQGWRARFRLSPDGSTALDGLGTGGQAAGLLFATSVDASESSWGAGSGRGALAVANDVGPFAENLAPGAANGPEFDFASMAPPSVPDLAKALGTMVGGLTTGQFQDAPPAVVAQWGAHLLLAPSRLASRFGVPATRWLDEVAKLPKDLVLSAGVGLNAAAYLSSGQVDAGLETILVSDRAPTSALWERVGVVSSEAVVVQPSGSHFKNEEVLRAEVLIHPEGPVLENPLLNPGLRFDEHGVYLIQVDWLGLEAPMGHFGLLTPSADSLWPVFKLKTSRSRSELLESFVSSHKFRQHIAPFADTLAAQERVAFLYILELMIRGEFDRASAERFANQSKAYSGFSTAAPFTLEVEGYSAETHVIEMKGSRQLDDDELLVLYCAKDPRLLERLSANWLKEVIHGERGVSITVSTLWPGDPLSITASMLGMGPGNYKGFYCRYAIRSREEANRAAFIEVMRAFKHHLKSASLDPTRLGKTDVRQMLSAWLETLPLNIFVSAQSALAFAEQEGWFSYLSGKPLDPPPPVSSPIMGPFEFPIQQNLLRARYDSETKRIHILLETKPRPGSYITLWIHRMLNGQSKEVLFLGQDDYELEDDELAFDDPDEASTLDRTFQEIIAELAPEETLSVEVEVSAGFDDDKLSTYGPYTVTNDVPLEGLPFRITRD